MDRLTTGNAYLDREIGGGIEPGRIVGIRMTPGSQGELLLKSFSKANGAMYLSTTRTDSSIEEWLADDDGQGVSFAGIDGLMSRGSNDFVDLLEGSAGWNGNGTGGGGTNLVDIAPIENVVNSADRSIVIDPVNPLESLQEGEYMGFLHDLRHRINELNEVALLRMVDTASPVDNRWLTLDIADEVWELSVEFDKERVEFFLKVIKSRSATIPERPIKLNLGKSVSVDTSRDIS